MSHTKQPYIRSEAEGNKLFENENILLNFRIIIIIIFGCVPTPRDGGRYSRSTEIYFQNRIFDMHRNQATVRDAPPTTIHRLRRVFF